ncbi:hypothetical protein JOB18_009075 [Solea senegalensis]|uniref:Uncharacterized protein n=1 Tax=Solea senegalensis TaxID=28829 RepID=A0AAV6RBL1_SOLSE|nr:hypothetical protein JOB18_009075 [Solea senegalensis]
MKFPLTSSPRCCWSDRVRHNQTQMGFQDAFVSNFKDMGRLLAPSLGGFRIEVKHEHTCAKHGNVDTATLIDVRLRPRRTLALRLTAMKISVDSSLVGQVLIMKQNPSFWNCEAITSSPPE